MNKLIALSIPGGNKFVDEVKRQWDQQNAILPLDVRQPISQQRHIALSLSASMIIDADGNKENLPNSVDVEQQDALVIATSGTTGAPKGVIHTHQSVISSAINTSKALEVNNSDHWLACLPLSHIGGFSVITKALYHNIKLTVIPGFEKHLITELTNQKNGPNLVSLVSTALSRIDASIFRKILVGGSSPPIKRATNVIATYGSTETGSGVIYESLHTQDIDSLESTTEQSMIKQQLIEGVELKIDHNSQLWIKSPTLFRCYRDGLNPTINGWFPTGDAAFLDPITSHLSILGRIEYVINSGGEKIWPEPLEKRLNEHPYILDSLAYGKPDKEWGQKVTVDLILKNTQLQLSLKEIQDWVKHTLPNYYSPKEINNVSYIPQTAIGKKIRPVRSNSDKL